MKSFEIKSFGFDKIGIASLGTDQMEINWPVIYQIYNEDFLYVGETTNLKNRMLQHLQNTDKAAMSKVSVVFDETYNKSAALDLESQLIQWFSGDGRYKMLNRNDGIADREYYNRAEYQQQFSVIWEQLRGLGIATKTITEIENSGLFKFSPYKRLNENQSNVVFEVLTDLDEAFKLDRGITSVVGGDEGTGKTIVLMYLIKLIRDIQDYEDTDEAEELDDQIFELFFKQPFRNRFKGRSIALVIPNPSLKGSVSKIFKGIGNLSDSVEVLSPIEYGSNHKAYDITFIDEAHLLKSSNQEVHKANRQKVDQINAKLFGDRRSHTELDWVIKKSKNVVMVYGDQRVRPNNIAKTDIRGANIREHILKTQIRSSGGNLYIDYLKAIFSSVPPAQKQSFPDFEFKLYLDFKHFVEDIQHKNNEVGLSRIVAGFAWDWKSKRDKTLYDIEIDGVGLKWNSTLSDWVGSPKSVSEVGSIYTIQGYDLNYCGVIIGKDIGYDPVHKKLIFNKSNYFDRGAKKRTKHQIDSDIQLSDEELLAQVIRIYRILMNRSIRGTYVYVCDPDLRDYLARYIITA